MNESAEYKPETWGKGRVSGLPESIFTNIFTAFQALRMKLIVAVKLSCFASIYTRPRHSNKQYFAVFPVGKHRNRSQDNI